MNIAKRRLTDEELDELDEMLFQIGGEDSMSPEEIDGFQCALIVCPELVRTSEYLPKMLGVALSEAVIRDEKTLSRLMELLMQNWNSIVSDLLSGGYHVPLMSCDEKGQARGNDWANAFLMGTDLRREVWGKVFKDEDTFAPMIPIFALAYENHPDKKLRSYKKPVSKKLRERLIVGATASLKVLYDRRLQSLRGKARTVVGDKTPEHKAGKIGRNDPCYCGSEKKYKKCCGAIKVN